jgi:Starch-binding associating with outer membrane
MKKLSIITCIGIAVALLGSSCGKGWLSDLQNNPNAPTTGQVTPTLVLPACISNLVSIVNNVTATGSNPSYEPEAAWLGYWNYQPGYSFVSSIQDYIMTSSGPQLWDNYYGVLTNLNFLVRDTIGGNQYANYHDISQILEAICFQNLVDLYGDIPYSQALQVSTNFFPAYDKQSDIYDSLTAKLDNAMADITANLSNSNLAMPSSDDIMFGGNMQAWVQFANTVKLRLLVREVNVTSKTAFITSEINKTASYGYITSDALVNPGYTSSQPNQIWGGFGVSPSGSLNYAASFIGANATALNFYLATNDVRVGYFYSPVNVTATTPGFFNTNVSYPGADTLYAANPLGIQAALPNGSSNIGQGLVQSPSQSAVMISAAESYFIQAEATLYGWLPGGNSAAQTLYQDAITKSYEFLNVGGSITAADAAAAAYYSQNLPWVAFPIAVSTDSLLHTLLEQKWAALNGINVAEPYADWRKTFVTAANTGWPMVPASISPSNTETHMPFRYYYPSEEQQNNNASWTADGGANVDPFNTRLFWMPQQ